MPKALITGITGQDGAYLASFLLGKGYKVAGTIRRTSTPNPWRLLDMGILNAITYFQADLSDMASMLEAIMKWHPDEVYHLAAQSYVEASFNQPLSTIDISGTGTARLLEVMRQIAPFSRFYNAGTSELYGNSLTLDHPADESTPFRPASPYAAAKALGCDLTRIYRESYKMYAVNGILFNHESPMRGLEFVTRKITNGVVRIKLGLDSNLILGNLDSERDWGYAPEYIKGMWLMLQQDEPTDFILATGETHSVREVCNIAFHHLGLDPSDYVRSSRSFLRPNDVNRLIGNPEKAQTILGWKPDTSFEVLIKEMVDMDLFRWQDTLKGKIVHWDAPNFYPILYNHEGRMQSHPTQANKLRS